LSKVRLQVDRMWNGVSMKDEVSRDCRVVLCKQDFPQNICIAQAKVFIEISCAPNTIFARNLEKEFLDWKISK
jgi:hypothetical protein